MNVIRLFIRISWISVTLAVFTGLLSGASNAGLIALINLTLSNISSPQTTMAWSFVGLCFLLLLTTTASQILLAHLSQKVIFYLRLGLNRRILACPLRRLEEIGSPKLLAALTEDVEAISTASLSISSLCVNIALLAGCLIYLSWLSTPVFLFMLGFMVLGTFSRQLLVTKGIYAFKLDREAQDSLFQHFRTTTEGIKKLKLHKKRRMAFLRDLRNAAAASQHYRVTGMTKFAIAASWGLLIFFIPIGLLLYVLPQITTIEVPVLSGSVLTIIFMITPMRVILNTLPELSRANIALEKVDSLGLSFATQTIEPNLTTTIDLAPGWRCLKLEGITHAYQGERSESSFILGPIDLTFHSGELVFLIGGNGSGKSTLVKLITGLYIPETGVIRVDDMLITDENREWYRQQFAVVFSDIYLFERLLGLGNPDLDTQSQEYLVKLQLDHKVQVRDGTLSTTALSQGQRKRLALLTAYLEDRPFYVFDEWASDQDPIFKNIFYTQLLPELKNRGKSVLVISHDDQYFHKADRIVTLDYGKVKYDKRLHS
jgi:putative pyoverdin transport system ATP-binding/permease protein